VVLLHNVSKLVCQQAPAGPSFRREGSRVEGHVVAERPCPGSYITRRRRSGIVIMDSHVCQIRAESGLHFTAQLQREP